MKREFTHDDFEHFLKQSADNLRMKAPEGVWENLSKELAKRRRRFITGLSGFLLVTAVAGYMVATTQISKPDNAPVQQVQEKKITSSEEQTVQENKSSSKTVYLQHPSAPNDNRSVKKETASIELPPVQAENLTAIVTDEINTNEIEEPVSEPENEFTSTIVDSYPGSENDHLFSKTNSLPSTLSNQIYPFTIESVQNIYQLRLKKSKLEKQFYFTPTISYRKLAENKSYVRKLSPNAPSNYAILYGNINNMVTHKPDLGFELGYTLKYGISPKLKVRSGLQFNLNRYDIKAFSAPLSLATIALNGRNRVDSLNTISGYSNVKGYQSNWLQNFSLQISAPVGVELALSSKRNMQLGIATSVQPTYILGDRSYLITTDYKSYTEVPWLLRRWNVNTSLETFVSYQAGKTKWQVGPQVRYQLLSSFISKYPVKENLFDFGLKIGVSVQK